MNPSGQILIPNIPGIDLIRLPFDIACSAYVLTFVALVNAGIVKPHIYEDGMPNSLTPGFTNERDAVTQPMAFGFGDPTVAK